MKTDEMIMTASAPADAGRRGLPRIAVPVPRPFFVAPCVPDEESFDSAPPTLRDRSTGRA